MKFYTLAKKHQWLLMLTGALLAVALGFALHFGRLYVQQQAMDMAVKSLKDIVSTSFQMIQSIEKSTDAMVPLIEQHLDKPDTMFTYSRQILKENPNIKGCSISFEPYFFTEKGKYFSAYSYSGNDTIQTEQEGDDNYQYFCMDWYLIPQQLNRKYWIEPYTENNSDGVIVKEVMTTYCQPLHDKDGRTVGVLSTDVPLKWLSDAILSHHPFKKSYCMLIGRGGTYIVHPDTTRLMYETILTPTLVKNNADLTRLGRAMIGGETGSMALMAGDVEKRVFYMPFGRTGWSLALVCEESVLMFNYYIVSALISLLILIAVIIMLTPLWVRISYRQ